MPIREFPNCFIISEPDHPAITSCLEKVLSQIINYRPFRDGVGREGVLRLTGPIPYTKSIIPFLATDLVRVSYYENLGFRYTYYPFPSGLHLQLSDHQHYTKLLVPVIVNSRSNSFLVQIYFGFQRLFSKIVLKLKKLITNKSFYLVL